MPRMGHAIAAVYRRPGADALPAHLAAHHGFCPHREYITALATKVGAAA